MPLRDKASTFIENSIFSERVVMKKDVRKEKAEKFAQTVIPKEVKVSVTLCGSVLETLFWAASRQGCSIEEAFSRFLNSDDLRAGDLLNDYVNGLA
jgi:N-glycosylase/DNA lyase